MGNERGNESHMENLVQNFDAILITGPTASGKSALALALAQQTGGVIVNADSAQIYSDLRILSAAPTEDERARADHRLYGVQNGALPCSAAEWAGLARAEVERVHGEGRTPILVGGTGLYLRTLLNGIAPVPAIDPEIRERVRAITGITPVVELVPPRTLPRTSSGKLSRTKARNLYLTGEIVPYDIAA